MSLVPLCLDPFADDINDRWKMWNMNENHALWRCFDRRRHFYRSLNDMMQPFRSATNFQIREDGDGIHAELDMSQYSVGEIQVRISGGLVSIEAEHQSTDEKQGKIYRKFHQQFTLPADVVTEEVKAQLGSQGTLIISAPRRPAVKEEHTFKPIPITFENSTNAADGKDDTK